MQELINVLTRTKTGLYDLVIVSGGETLLSVGSVTKKQAYRLIDEQEEKHERNSRVNQAH